MDRKKIIIWAVVGLIVAKVNPLSSLVIFSSASALQSTVGVVVSMLSLLTIGKLIDQIRKGERVVTSYVLLTVIAMLFALMWFIVMFVMSFGYTSDTGFLEDVFNVHKTLLLE